MVSFRKDLHYYMLILVQVRSKGGVLHVEQKMCRCSVVLISLGEYMVQVHTGSYRTSVSSSYSMLYLRIDFNNNGVH